MTYYRSPGPLLLRPGVEGGHPWRFRVLADAEPSALICILQYLRRSNVAPKSVSSICRTGGNTEMKIEIDNLPREAFQDLVAGGNDMSMVIARVAFDLDWTHAVSCA